MNDLKQLPPYAPIDPGVRKVLNRYADRLNWLTKEVERLKEIVEKMEPDV